MIKNMGVFKDFSDNSLKSVFEGENHEIIEMSLLANKEQMDVVCVPTHHFCSLGCKMCHLTRDGLNKKMIPIETKDFIECLVRTVTIDGKSRRTNKEKLLISFMGVGEPLLNLKLIEEVYMNEKVIKEKFKYKTIGYALATMMPNDNIVKLHRTNDPVEIHYTLISEVNDGKEELGKVCELLEDVKIPIKFIRFNPTGTLQRSVNETKWIETITQKVPNLRIKTYAPPGRQIGSSCGEFTKHYYHQEIETQEEREAFEKWKIKHQIA